MAMDRKGVNLHHLYLFYNIAKFKSITKAAAYLKITQPAISIQIKKFQKKSGVQFFDIIDKKINLTPIGKSLYLKCEELFCIKNSIEEIIYGNKSSGNEIINIHTTLPFGEYYFNDILSNINKELKNISIRVLTRNSDNIIEKILKFKTDIGIIGREIKHPKLITKQLLRDYLVLICSPKHDLARKKIIYPEELEKYNVIMHEHNSSVRIIVEEYAKKNNISLNIREEIYSIKLLTEMIKKNYGISITSKHIISKEIQQGTLKAIPVFGGLYRYFYLVYHKEKYISPSMQAIIFNIENWCEKYNDNLLNSIAAEVKEDQDF